MKTATVIHLKNPESEGKRVQMCFMKAGDFGIILQGHKENTIVVRTEHEVLVLSGDLTRDSYKVIAAHWVRLLEPGDIVQMEILK